MELREFRPAAHLTPSDEPHEPDKASEPKRTAPPVLRRDWSDNPRRDHRAQRSAAISDRHAARTALDGQGLHHGPQAAGARRTFAKAEKSPRRRERPEAAGERVANGCESPYRDGSQHSAANTQPVEQPA